MADKRIEWQIALDSAGVSKGVKGIDAELSSMRKAFDSLQNVKAFDAQLTALNDLASKLEAAKAKAAALAPAAEAGGKAAQNAYAKAAAEVARLEQSLRSQTSVVAASAAALDKAGISTKDLAAETARVAEEYKAAAAAAGQAAKSQEAWAATGARSTKELETEIAKLQQLTKSGLLDERGIAAVEARIESLNKELGRTPPAAREGEGALAGLTAGAKGLAAAYLSVEAAKQAITVTAEFGDELQAVAAFSGATAAEMAKLRQNALDLAGAAGGPRAIAAGMADLATAGASASEILGTTGIVRDMAAASKGALDFAQAGDLLTNILKQYGLQITDAQPVADKLVKGWSSAGQTADELGAGLLEVGSIYKDLYRNLGSTAAIDKSAAAISVLADVGFKGEKGGTALKNALAQLVAPAGEGAKVLEKYKDVIKIFDDTGNVRDFADIIDDVGRAGLSSEEKMKLFGREAGPAMAALVNMGGQAIRDMETKLKNADGTAAKVRATMQDGLGGAFRELNAQLEVAGISLADSVAKPLELVVRGGAEAIKVISALPPSIINAATATVSLVTAAAGITTAMAGWEMIGPTVLSGVSSFVQIQKAAGAAELSIAAIGPAAGAAKAGILSVGATAAAVMPTIAAFAAVWGIGKIIEFGSVAIDTYKAVTDASAAAARAQDQQGRYEDRLKRASAAAGVELKSWREVQAAYQSGILDYDKMTDTYSKGSGVARAAADVHAAGAEAVGAAAAASRKSIEELDEENKVLFDNAKKKYEEYAKGIKEASGNIMEIGLLPTNTKKALDELDDLMAVAGQAGTAMTKAWTDPADAVATYVPRLLGAADAEEAAVRQSLAALSAKDKALEAQHRQTLLNGKLIIDQVGAQAEASKAEQAALQPAIAGQKANLNAIMEVKSANGALIPGMQMVAGVWTSIGVAADRSNKQQLDGLRGLRLGMSSLAEELYELSLVGKTQEQIWKANQIAAAQYLQSAKELGAQAKREALKGNDEGAKQLWAAEAAAIAKADALYRKLAVTVKTEWSPAMETAHKQSTETITKFGSAAGKALDQARAGYDKVADAAQRSADAQQYFADKLRDVARESMTEAEAYEDIKRAAAEATAEADRLAKAGDWKGAQEQAKAAAEAWAQVPKEVKAGEQTLVSSAESAQVRADGIRQAAEISKAAYAAERKELEANAAAAQRNAEIIIAAERAIVAATAEKLAALKAGNASAAAAADEEIAAAKARAEAAAKEVEAAAQKSGDSSGAQATQAQIDKINELVKANEEAAAKIKALEEEKGKTISEESENAKIAAEGVVAAQQQLVDAYDEQRSTLEGLASTEVAIMESVAKATTSASAEIKSAAAAAATELEKIKAGIDAIPANKEVTITVREVQARAGGGSIGTVTAMATGGLYARDARKGMHFPGFGGGDRWSNLVIAENGEYMQRKEATAALGGDGLALARAQNNLDFARMQSILAKHLGPPQIKLDMPAPRQPQMQQLGVIKLHVGDVQAEVYATPDNAAAIHAAIAEAQRRAQHAANARRRAGAK